MWLIADRNVASLLAFRDHPHRIATDGSHGSGQRKHGKRGRDLEVKVPEGTMVYTLEGEFVVDLAHHGDRWPASEGGRGGMGNARFLSNRRRAPAFAEQGEHRSDQWYRLELKLLADVALVGFPSVGKSTLISVISAAKPRIADYPFTTLEPNLGVVRLDGTEYVVADLPGLIEGAAEGRGLGFRFLRHTERARVLLFMVDLADLEGPSPREQLETLREELGSYRPDLLERPSLVVGTKADVLTDDDWGDDAPVDMIISSVTGEGIQPLKWKLAELVDSVRDTGLRPDFVVHRPLAEGVQVTRQPDGSWVVEGREAERAVSLSDINAPGAWEYAQGKLDKLGVNRALKRAGVGDGDIVHIGDFAFDYEMS